MTTKMNPQVKEMWVNALRSGDYNQTQGKLRTPGGFCCLGVLTDLYLKEKNYEWIPQSNDPENISPEDYYTFEQTDDFLPTSVQKWAGLNTSCPEVMVENPYYDEDDLFDKLDSTELSELNDNGSSFIEIADLIESQL